MYRIKQNWIELNSLQWMHKGSAPIKKGNTQAYAGKLKERVFWDNEGILGASICRRDV